MSELSNIINDKREIAMAFQSLLMMKIHCKVHPDDTVINDRIVESMTYMYDVWTDKDLPETIRAIAYETFSLQLTKLTDRLENAIMQMELKRMNAELN